MTIHYLDGTLRPRVAAVTAFLIIVCLGCDSSDPAPTVEQPLINAVAEKDEEDIVQARIEPSVVYLQFFAEAGDQPLELASYGTGFVVADRQGKKWIATTAHSLEPTKSGKQVISVRYRLTRNGKFADCGKAIVDQSYDLAVLQPHPGYPLAVDALELLNDSEEIPKTLYALGSASALEFNMYHAVHWPKIFTAAQWAKELVLPISAFKPLAPDVAFLQHGISIAPGYSGCPIVTRDGKVVGIQSHCLNNAHFVAFAIHYKHIRDFDWTRAPQDLKAVDLAPSNINGVLTHTRAPAVAFEVETSPPKSNVDRPPTVRLKGVSVEAPFVHHGYVEPNAETVIRDYIQDREWYTEEKYGGYRVLQLQQLLNRTRLARISNPLLGFQMLVPEGYRYSTQGTTNPDGLLVTFSVPAERIVKRPYDRPVSVWVKVEPQLFELARHDFLKRVDAGTFVPTAEERANPILFAIGRDRMINATIADLVEPRFVRQNLGIQLETANSAAQRSDADLFNRTLLGEGTWVRSNYHSTRSTLAHIVRVTTRDPLVVVVHHQFASEDAAAFNSLDGNPNLTFQEYLILAASVSMK